MASSHDNVSMALFCDFENVALGVRDANYDKFDIKPVLERLLLKGSIVLKKAYCDWDRYKGFKAAMHEANFELIEIPHVRQSGKNSADIRLVVDALDLCYTKSHVNTFVIISGDSDFSPLVSKLRENAKQVIGVGVKQSTSDLLIANCDEFIFYDDLVREIQRSAARREARETPHAPKRPPEEDKRRKEELEARKTKAIELAVETFDALVAERGDSGKIWASMLKEALKRRKPDFSESYYGFRAFGNLLEEAQARGLLEFGRDEKSGAYVYRSSNRPAASEALSEQGAPALAAADAGAEPAAAEEAGGKHETRRRGRGGRKSAARTAEPVAVAASEEAHAPAAPVAEAATTIGAEAGAPAAATEEAATHEPRRRGRGGRKPAATAVESLAPASNAPAANAPASNAPASNAGEPLAPAAAPAALLVSAQHSAETTAPVAAGVASEPAAAEETTARHEPRRRGRGGRKAAAHKAEALAAEMSAGAPQAPVAPGVASERPAPGAMLERSAPRTRRSRGAADFSTPEPAPAQAPAPDEASTHAAAEESSAKPARKPAAPRSRRPRKAATAPENG